MLRYRVLVVGSPRFRARGGPSRWSTKRSAEWLPLKSKLVVEVCYDHFTGDRFRHGTRLMRWRPDKDPEDCTFEQLDEPVSYDLSEVLSGGAR